MVRIVIDTEGDKAATTMPQGEAAAQAAAEAPTPPAEVLAAAAVVGAKNAGPAPSFGATTTGAPPLPPATPEAGAPGAGPEDQAAGAAPGTPPEPQPTVVTEDGE
jgi:hypothetical protein